MITLAKLCKQQGMDIHEYRETKAHIEQVAKNIVNEMEQTHQRGTGMYFPLHEYLWNYGELKVDIDKSYLVFLKEELNKLGVEITNNLSTGVEMFRLV